MFFSIVETVPIGSRRIREYANGGTNVSEKSAHKRLFRARRVKGQRASRGAQNAAGEARFPDQEKQPLSFRL